MGIGTLWGREPVMFLAVIQAALAMAMGFGLHFTANQMALTMAFTSAVLGFLTRTQVTAMATLPDQLAAQIVTAAHADVEKIPVPPIKESR